MNKRTKKEMVDEINQAAYEAKAKEELEDQRRVAREIDVVLTTNGYGLQPYIIEKRAGNMIFGFDPAVRLVKIPKDEPKTDTEVGAKSTEGAGEVS